MRRMHELYRQSLSLYVEWNDSGNNSGVTLGFNFLSDEILTGSGKQLAEQLYKIFGSQTIFCSSYNTYYQGGKIIGLWVDSDGSIILLSESGKYDVTLSFDNDDVTLEMDTYAVTSLSGEHIHEI